MSGKEHQPCGVAHSSPLQLTAAARREFPYALCVLALGACALVSSVWAPLAAAQDATLLTRMLHESRSDEVREHAAAAIGQRRDLDKRPDLEVALLDRHPNVRAAAAKALGRIGSRASLLPLHEVARDPVKKVASEAQQAIHTIQTQVDLKPTAPQPVPVAEVRVGEVPVARATTRTEPALVETSGARYGLMLGEMRNQSAYREVELVRTLGAAVERNVKGFGAVAIFAARQLEQMTAAQARGLGVFRLDGSVTSLSATTLDGQIWLHCEVLLLVMERSTGLLRSVLKGAARGVEMPAGEYSAQKRQLARRVVDAAVRSALRNADAALDDALHRSTTVVKDKI